MIVYNGAQKPIAVRAFAGNQITEPNHFVLIDSGKEENVFGPCLMAFGFNEPYLLLGDVLVRDWGPIQVFPKCKADEVVLENNKGAIFKRPFSLNLRMSEGFLASYYDQTQFIGF